LTVSDHLLTGESTSAETREKDFLQMIELALAVAKDIPVALEDAK